MFKIAYLIAVAAIAPVFAVDTCRLATGAEFDALPGKDRFLQLVKDDFGGRAPVAQDVNHGDTPVSQTVRSDGSTDRSARLCMSGGPFQAAPAQPGDMTCSSQIADFGGDFSGGDGGDGTITAQLQSGYSVAGQWSTTASTAVGTGMSTSVNVAIPGFGGIDTSFSTTFTTTNEESSSTTSTINQIQTFSATANVPKGATCTMHINVTTCNLKTSITVPIVFNGFVHNHFDREVTWSGQGRDNKHKYWWVNPAIYSMTPAELSSSMTVSGSLQSTSYGQAYVTCTGGDAGAGTSTTAISAGSKSASTVTASGSATSGSSGPSRLRY